ncbi:hypothetical protein BaRGS_00013799 [Batillaria attramentaria]|uniref:Uncharacterized protein n=1 Tax=Batillaria attramentaria TaxID=370345 RepID=A0ABD0L6Z1_9CAEN
MRQALVEFHCTIHFSPGDPLIVEFTKTSRVAQTTLKDTASLPPADTRHTCLQTPPLLLKKSLAPAQYGDIGRNLLLRMFAVLPMSTSAGRL